MATYNGSRYVDAQLVSILEQLSPRDEVVIVDDCSADDTVARIEALDDDRIRIICTKENRGHVKAFESAIRQATGEIIFLSDQDDIWLPGRVEAMTSALREHLMVATSYNSFGEAEPSPPLTLSDQTSAISNIWGLFAGTRPYLGCVMAFRSDLRDIALPFPGYVEAHDQWLAMVANVAHGMKHLPNPSLLHRLHSSNVSPNTRRPLKKQIRTRVIMARYLMDAVRRTRKTATM